ncbi:hypothetical protein [Mesonia maritima]|uniref:Uncharacterized protein n=1 Tax=Mesonia maritima TaxID=1793873 RepID=A0ABU1K4X4_9FLAO|nr:hypothetical protein [Mesonia maritima]MDR6300639.1 hypothetical protein [Mesonia maritima]
MKPKIQQQKRFDELRKKMSRYLKDESDFYSFNEMLEAHGEVIRIEYLKKVLPKKLRVSARKAIIVYLERKFGENYLRSDFTLDELIPKAKVQYDITSADKKKLKCVNHVHPPFPCNYFKNDLKSLNGYHKAICDIMILRIELELERNVYRSINTIEKEVKQYRS